MRYVLKTFPPSANHRLQIMRIGRSLRLGKSPKYRQWQAIALNELKEQVITPVQGKIELCLDVYMPDRRKRDLDNIVKSVQDVLTLANAFEDDSNVYKLVVNKAGVGKQGIFIKVKKLDD